MESFKSIEIIYGSKKLKLVHFRTLYWWIFIQSIQLAREKENQQKICIRIEKNNVKMRRKKMKRHIRYFKRIVLLCSMPCHFIYLHLHTFIICFVALIFPFFFHTSFIILAHGNVFFSFLYLIFFFGRCYSVSRFIWFVCDVDDIIVGISFISFR